MANNTVDTQVEAPVESQMKSSEVTGQPKSPVESIYGTTEKVKDAASRIRNGDMQLGDLDLAFGHL